MYPIFFLASCLVLSLLGHLASASPVVRKSLNPKYVQKRSPVTASAFAATDAEWPTNVLFTGASQTYGLWVPMDGAWYDLGGITCLGLPAYAEGPCNGVTINAVGVVAGDGPCSFLGNDGYSATLPGNAGDGWFAVAPPQNIMSAKCG
ncbi:uncharacterized protein PV06_05800 [Exophiala oligosperma]|uniref:Uncharacterized protein n=2 Tax=Chaetothyriales TaxID=34395 RepID=A0A0D2AQK3_9EURO|nr:uncharacterized protein PV06_05800 [Exophiala oligosperma]KAJ9622130.1 hypothetical protein H2204_011711 [Knufia peltigerae]KIW42236.1 hypothetical protein PV06_05800 [Exophiala oligosperma]